MQRQNANKFSFNTDILRKKEVSENIFLYKTELSLLSKTTFYFIDCLIPETNKRALKELHVKILSEDLANFYILPKTSNKTQDISYHFEFVKANYSDRNKTIFSIPANTDDKVLLDKIKRSNFDSGLFWIEFRSNLNKIKKISIDKLLISRLRSLRESIQEQYEMLFNSKKYENLFENEKEKSNQINEYTQALIDRTLFIKYLEDKSIVNSWYYNDYTSYKSILADSDADKLNDLFKKVNNIFNNSLFEKPDIEIRFLTKEILDPIYQTISGNDEYGQLSLFDLQFDLIPIETISLIYNIFLEEVAAEKGIFYTPKELAQFIVNETINTIAPTLDCSCGSGAFLIMSFRRMLELSREKKCRNIGDEILRRNKILSKNIFGVEKEDIACRLSVFSVTLELLNGLDTKELQSYISEGVKTKGNKFKLFDEKFHENIVCSNALIPNSEIPLKKKDFTYLVGNPPWKSDISKTKALEEYNYWLNNREFEGKAIFEGKNQLSQLFLHKINDWAIAGKTKFGFVVNSTNFQGENAFQDYFFSTYTIEKVYELSKLKNFVFDTAKEPAIVLIFNNKAIKNNKLQFTAPELSDFAKHLNVVLLQNSNIIEIEQDLLWGENKSDSLRNYLYGNENDRELISKLRNIDKYESLQHYILKDKNDVFIRQGVTLWGENALSKRYKLNKKDLSKSEYEFKRIEFLSKYKINKTARNKETKPNLFVPFIGQKDIKNKLNIVASEVNNFIFKDLNIYHRGRYLNNFKSDRIICSRISKRLFAVHTSDFIINSDALQTIKLAKSELIPIVVVILNSNLSNYFIDISLRKRPEGNLSRLNDNDLLTLPIPKNIEHFDLSMINSLVDKVITEKSIELTDKINNEVAKIYSLNYFEQQRINDFYKTGKATKKDIEKYCKIFIGVLNQFSKNKDDYIFLKPYLSEPKDFGIIVAKIVKNNPENQTPDTKKTGRYIFNEILEKATNFNIFNLRERIYSEDTIYIIKDRNIQNWTITRAYEDVQNELNKHYESK